MGYLEKSKSYKGYHYSVLKPNMIDYLHSTTLDILREVVKVFEEENIRYMICGGTLLGAVTTGKFIPWDDDVDLCVLDEDYARMQQCLLQRMPEWILVQCEATEPHYYHGWMKVRDKHSCVYPNEKQYACNGVWLDVYRLTKTRRHEIPYLIAKEHIDYLNRRCAVGCMSPEERDRRIRDRQLTEQMRKAKDEMMAHQDDEDWMYTIWSASKIQVEPEWVVPTRAYTFEGIRLQSFNNADAYLRQHYGGNYTMLPPDEMRRVGISNIEININGGG